MFALKSANLGSIPGTPDDPQVPPGVRIPEQRAKSTGIALKPITKIIIIKVSFYIRVTRAQLLSKKKNKQNIRDKA